MMFTYQVCPFQVRKHRAPKGALRPDTGSLGLPDASGVRKHRAPKGALRPITTNVVAGTGNLSESTERQKVH